MSCKLRCLSLLVVSIFLSVLNTVADDLTPIKIGWSGPLSGNSAVVGIDAVPAIELVFNEINQKGGIQGHPLKLVIEDDAYDTTKAVNAYKKLVHQDKVSLIFASTYGGVFATARDALADGVIVIDTLDCNEDIARLPQNTLCLATQTESIAHSFAADIQRRKYSSVMILVEESDGWMQLISRTASMLLKNAHIEVYEAATLASETNYKSLLLRAKSRAVDALIILGNDQMGNALAQARQIGIKAQVYGIGSFLSPGFQALAGRGIEGALVSSWEAPRTVQFAEFLDKFKAKVGRAPYLELAVLPAFDFANLMVPCLSSAFKDGQVSTDLFRSCILATTEYQGVSGKITFDSDGAVRSIQERLYRVHEGKLGALVDPVVVRGH